MFSIVLSGSFLYVPILGLVLVLVPKLVFPTKIIEYFRLAIKQKKMKIISLQDEDGEEYNIPASDEDYEKIINGDYQLANIYLQKEIERKNRLLAYQLLLNEKADDPKTSSIGQRDKVQGTQDSNLALKASCSFFCNRQSNSTVSVLNEETDDVLNYIEMESSAEGSLYENSSMLTDFNASSRWSDKETKLLIELFKTNFEKLNDKKYKSKSIYAEISKHFSRFTTEQVESKIKNLKKSYKSILDNNSKTGRGKITWPYFTSMNEIFGRDPENSPMSIASNTLGFIKSPDSQDTSDSENISETPKKKVKIGDSRKLLGQPEWFKELRAEMESRHRERMEKQQQFLDIFREYVNKSK